MLTEKNDDTPQGNHEETARPEIPENPADSTEESPSAAPEHEIAEGEEDAQAEIDASNAEDAEDEDNKERHTIPMPDYHAMPVEKLVKELDKLLANEKVQAIKKHVEEIRHEFDLKYQEFLEQKKEDFINDGGSETDFKYTLPVKVSFNKSYALYKEKRNQYYKNLEQTLHANLARRLEIIEALRKIINVEEDINIIYKNFKELQEQWRKAGPVPRAHYNDLWKTYQHHTEIFYDFLDLNRDLREVDFRKNLEEKEKIITKAQALLEEEDIHKAFRELQMLHKIWKEDIGPVDRQHREGIWEKFSGITKAIHRKRQEYFNNIHEIHQQNLLKKEEIIREIERLASHLVNSHGGWQKQIRQVEALRQSFFEAGKVPYKSREKIWAAFKEANKNFNRNKNTYYKKLKKEHLQNLKKKIELLQTAESLKDSEDWEKTTPMMKEIQTKWGKIGHVPKKYSDDIWKKFKEACNHYFNRLHARRGETEKRQHESLSKKKELLQKLTAFEPGDAIEKDLEAIQEMVSQWRALSQDTYRKRNIEDKFNKTLGALFAKLGLEKEEAELIKYENKLEYLADNDELIENERLFIKRRVGELEADIRQLENNLQFINAKADNPVVKEVRNKIDKHKEDLAIWEAKLEKLKSL